MRFEKRYRIDLWTKWGKSLNDAIDGFFKTNSVLPNIMEANSYTYSQFDFVTNINDEERENVSRIDDSRNWILPVKGEDIKIGAYQNNLTSLEFAVDEALEDKEFRLIYDSNPDWE